MLIRAIQYPYPIRLDIHTKRTIAAFVEDSPRAPRPGAPVLRVYDPDGNTRDLLPDDLSLLPDDPPDCRTHTAAVAVARWVHFAHRAVTPSETHLDMMHLAEEFLRGHPARLPPNIS